MTAAASATPAEHSQRPHRDREFAIAGLDLVPNKPCAQAVIGKRAEPRNEQAGNFARRHGVPTLATGHAMGTKIGN
jgi:hypothetical protein